MNIGHKLKKVFSKYPENKINPALFKSDGLKTSEVRGDKAVLAVQLLTDKFFYLLFGLIAKKIKEVNSIRVEGLVVGSVNATIGVGLKAELLRLPWLTHLRTAPWIRAYGDLLDGVAYRCATWDAPWQMWKDWRRATKLQAALAEQPIPRKFKIDGVEVADLIIDSYLRFKPSPEFEVNDKFVRRLIWQAIQDIRKAKKYFEKNKPKWYLTSYTTYLEHGIPARVAMQTGVQVISFGNLAQFYKRHDGQDWFHTPDFSKYRDNFEQLPNPDGVIDEARKLLQFRLSGGVDQVTSYMKESAYKNESNEALPADLKGAVVIFLHDFYDSPHVYSNLIFDDFWSWINATIEVLGNSNIKFYLKPHPNQVSLSDAAIQRLKKERPNLRWLKTSVNNVQLAQAGIAGGVTAYGTVAHELAYLGVPSVSCALHPHHAFNFSKTANTVAQYEEYLKELPHQMCNKETMSKEALMFFWAHNLNKSHSERVALSLKIKLWKESQLLNSDCSELLSELSSILNTSEIFE